MKQYYIYSQLLLILLIGCSSAVSDESSPVNDQLFNTDWEFAIDSNGASRPDQLDSFKAEVIWERVQLPHTAHLEPLVVNDQWQGNCWYRKSFAFHEEWSGQRIFLRFEGAMNVAEVWMNGKKKITHLGGYLPFVIDITDDLQAKDSNWVYVKLNNEDNPVTGPKPLEILDFNMYGGIYRDVYMQIKNPVHISDPQFADVKSGGGVFVSYPEVTKEKATVSIKTHVRNSGSRSIQAEIHQTLESGGETWSGVPKRVAIAPGESVEINQEIGLNKPSLWSPASPHLYNLVTTVKEGKGILDSERTRIGIRKFEFIENKLFINGENAFLRGVNRHQEYPYIGYALSNNAQYRDALKIKEAGFDYVRMSHYPHSQSFMDACDELGLIAIDAILGWQYFDEREAFKSQIVKTSRDLIRRDRNHPCVLAWEVSLNESWMPEQFIDALVQAAKEEYPMEGCFTAGWQLYAYDIYLQARQHRLGHPDRFPNKPYIVSEYGDWEYYAMNAGLNQDDWGELLEKERSSRQPIGSGERRLLQQALNLQEAHNDNLSTPAVADGFWVMYDYNRGYSDDLEYSGIMSIFRLPKYSYYFFQSQRSIGETVSGVPNDPMVFIASEWSESSSRDIRIFSNCEEVELFLNGVSLGIQRPDSNRISNHLNHPPFTFLSIPETRGILTARGIQDGRSVAEHMVRTSGDPVKIVLEADISGRAWESGVNDVIFIHARIVDKNMQTVRNYSEKISFEISGKAIIMGEHSPNAEGGIATILVRAGDVPDKISIATLSGELRSDPYILRTE